MEKHYIEFYSPGTMVAEVSRKEIASWDVKNAVEMARNIKERHGATPYGFRFITRGRGPDDFDSKETARSNMYHLGGTVRTLEEVKAANNQDERILLRNMESNGYDRVIENNNSYKATHPLEKDDIILDFEVSQ